MSRITTPTLLALFQTDDERPSQARPPLGLGVRLACVLTGLFRSLAGHRSRLRVDRISPEHPAARAGLRPGDVLMAVDGRPVRGMRRLRKALRGRGRRAIELRILRWARLGSGADRHGRQFVTISIPTGRGRGS